MLSTSNPKTAQRGLTTRPSTSELGIIAMEPAVAQVTVNGRNHKGNRFIWKTSPMQQYQGRRSLRGESVPPARPGHWVATAQRTTAVRSQKEP